MIPSTLAVLRLMTNSTLRGLLDWHIGRLFTLENSARVCAGEAIGISKARSVTHQTVRSSIEIAIWEDRRQRVLESHRGELLPSAVEELATTNHQPTCAQLAQVCENCIQVTFGADIQNMELQSETPGGRLHASCRFFRDAGSVGSTRSAMILAVGTTSCSNSSRFGATSTANWAKPVTLPPGRLRLATRPS